MQLLNKSTLSFVIVALVIGTAFGSIVFPQVSLQTTTSVTTITINGTPQVTVTRVTLLVFPVVATCITVSGTRSMVYTYAYGGQTTTLTTVFPPSLPEQYYATVVTDSTVSAVNQTVVQVPDTC